MRREGELGEGNVSFTVQIAEPQPPFGAVFV
jgi:hypothetical protein